MYILMMRRFAAVCLLPFFLTVDLMAGDQQVLNLSAPLKAFSGQPVTGVLDHDQVKDLVAKVLGGGGPGDTRDYVVHVVRYQDAVVSPEMQHWYVWDGAEDARKTSFLDYHAKDRYKDARIMGRHSLGLVYLHILKAVSAANVEAAVRANLGPLTPLPGSLTQAQMEDAVKADVEAIRGMQPANAVIAAYAPMTAAVSRTSAETLALWRNVEVEKTMLTLLQTGASGQVKLTSSSGVQLVPWNGYYVEKPFNNFTVTYSVTIAGKPPAPLTNLQGLVSLAFTAMGLQSPYAIELHDTPFAAGNVFETSYVPADITVAGTVSSDKPVDLGKTPFDNEGRYWYDFSAAVPFKSYNDLAYDATSNGLTARKTQKANVYAMFDFGVPRDTKNVNLQVIPALAYGIPISGQPLKHHILAGSIGLNKVNFFVGVRLDEKNFYRDFHQPLKGDNVFQVWRTHLTYGINFPVTTVVQALTKKK